MADEPRWVPPSLSKDPKELKRILRHLVIIAAMGAIAYIISAMAR